MNERIRKLLNRSGGEFYEGFAGSPNTIKFTEEEFKTFAELIVRECADVAFLEANSRKTQRAVLQHFGVEQ